MRTGAAGAKLVIAHVNSFLFIEESRLWMSAVERAMAGSVALSIAGVVASVPAARRMIIERRPSAVAIGLVSSDPNLRFHARALIREVPAVQALAYSISGVEPLDEAWALASGFMGYVAAHDTVDTLLDALDAVASGGRFFNPALDIPVDLRPADEEDPFSSLGQLSGREIEVFRMTGRGMSAKDIASRLGITVKTVDTYRLRIRQKLNVREPSDLLKLAIRMSNWTPAA